MGGRKDFSLPPFSEKRDKKKRMTESNQASLTQGAAQTAER